MSQIDNPNWAHVGHAVSEMRDDEEFLPVRIKLSSCLFTSAAALGSDSNGYHLHVPLPKQGDPHECDVVDPADLFPTHKAGLHLNHNEHRNYYQTVMQWEARIIAAGIGDGLGWVSAAQRQKSIEQDSVWALQWYPETPISSYRLLACDLDVLLAFAKEIT